MSVKMRHRARVMELAFNVHTLFIPLSTNINCTSVSQVLSLDAWNIVERNKDAGLMEFSKPLLPPLCL